MKIGGNHAFFGDTSKDCFFKRNGNFDFFGLNKETQGFS